MLRKPWFWIAFVAASALCVGVCVRYFTEVFPSVALDVKMDRGQALAGARQLAEKFGWGPGDAREAASFEGDDSTQVFVELEGGGKQKWAELVSGALYQPYTWNVRRFRPGETEETYVYFTAGGAPYGFRQILPEDRPGPALEAAPARAIAERAAAEDWGIDLAGYTLAEQSLEVRPAGRVDHRIVYQRSAERLGEGEYRLTLVVSGDRLTELTRWVKVPEAFERRYAEMRSSNAAIAQLGQFGLFGLLAVGGGFGLLYLMRHHALLGRPALFWGSGIGFLQALSSLNQLPLDWMTYDTATPASGFVGQVVVGALGEFAVWSVLLTLSFAVAEGLTRRAFPQQVQLWKLWSRDVASSPRVLGMTLAGLLLVSAFFVYEIGVYFASSRLLGWWVPSDQSESPNQLATYLPWLEAIATSARAGFWEESLFRALPLAGAALIGDRFGRRWSFVAVAFVVQALIFGSAHADYPTQPGYARLAELFLPSIAFGLLYLRLGLPAGVMLHYGYDAVSIALPLFSASSQRAWVDQGLAVGFIALPLGVVLAARARAGRWSEVPAAALNGAWRPAPVVHAEPQAVLPPRTPIPRATRSALWVAGAAGLLAFAALGRFRADAPALEIPRGAALERAREELRARGVDLDASWTEFARVRGDVDDADRFVWREGGPQIYAQLLGSHLNPPCWQIRYARFGGDIVSRAEEYHVLVSGTGRVLHVVHVLPEAQAGARLAEADARGIAQAQLRESFGLDPAALEEVLAQPQRQPGRDDWSFEYRDRSAWPRASGEARVRVSIAGDQIVDAFRYMEVPESWTRREREQRVWFGLLQYGSVGWLTVCVGIGAFAGIVARARGGFSSRAFLRIFAALLAWQAFQLWNEWPTRAFGFATTRGFAVQVFEAIATALALAVFLASAAGLGAGFLRGATEPGASSRAARWSLGLALGFAFAGAAQLLRALAGAPLEPLWGSYESAGAYLPLLDELGRSLLVFLFVAGSTLLSVNALDRATQRWTARRGAGAALFLLLFALPCGALAGGESAVQWIAGGLVLAGLLAAAYAFVLRHDPALIPLAVAGIFALGRVSAAVRGGHPAAELGCALSALLLLGVGGALGAGLAAPPPASQEGARGALSRGQLALR